MRKLSKAALDLEAIRQSIESSGEFRCHLAYARSGGVSARMWHPDGFRLGHAGGGGYDKRGAALGELMGKVFAFDLCKLTPGAISREDSEGRFRYVDNRKVQGSLYGLTRIEKADGRVTCSLDGACGLESMLAILRALGFKSVRLMETGRDSSMVLACKTGELSDKF